MSNNYNLLSRWYRLRKLGRSFSILAEHDNLWTFTNPYDPWGSRERLSWELLESLVSLEENKYGEMQLSPLPERRGVHTSDSSTYNQDGRDDTARAG